ncbi:MAG: cation:dicarboxylase symporter family transporter [Alphaproteobacteria bacterium]|nr:cation:dicarboxylase symporter family transporter [Alphaproteobacteria bacterium]
MDRKFFTSLPFILILMVLTIIIFGNYLPLVFKEFTLSLSLICKEIIIFVLPFIIFSFVVSGLSEFQSESFKLVAILIPLVCLSNFTGLWVSYGVSSPILSNSILKISQLQPEQILLPMFEFHLPTIIKNDYALLSAIVLVFVNNFIKSKSILKFSKKANIYANFVLKKVICPILPVFVLGFIIKMQYEGTLSLMIKEYSLILLLVLVIAYGYMATIMILLCKNCKSAIIKIKNLLPSVFIGLFSMSSAAAIPTTIVASEKNLEDEKLARFVVPAAANMHLLGDCFAIPILACALMISFGHHYPTPLEYLIFSLRGVLAKFAAAGIPGGSAIIFAPILIDTFGFSADMVTAFTTIYLIFDPVATSTNVFGHGMFAILFEKVYNKISK